MPSGGTYTAGQTFSVAAAPTRSNFKFTGWSDGTTTYQPGATYTVAAANVNLTAQWRQSSFAGTSNSDIARVLTWNIVGSESVDATVSSDSGNSSVRVVIPSNAFDVGTEVIFWRLTNQNVAKNAINSSYDFFVNFAISWSIGDDVSTAKRVLTARSPIQVTVQNSSIEKGATAWMIIGGVATQIGNASQDGEIQVSITEDPIITLANVTISNSVSSGTSPSAEALRAAREAAIQSARREIIKSLKDEKPISIKELNAADLNGATEKNIGLINLEISKLSDSSKEEISSIERILFKYLTIDRVARGERVNFRDLQSLGLISSDSKHKSSITTALRKAASIQVDSFEKIESFVTAVEKKFSDRKAALLAQIARIQALLGR
jgi:uncharacterized repeat protein (TIGR02543 family)